MDEGEGGWKMEEEKEDGGGEGQKRQPPAIQIQPLMGGGGYPLILFSDLYLLFICYRMW